MEVNKVFEVIGKIYNGNQLVKYEILDMNTKRKKIMSVEMVQGLAMAGALSNAKVNERSKTLTGINVIDTVLSSKTESEALQELKSKTAELEIDLKTKKVQYGIDYNLGDIVRVQNDGMTTKKKVIGVIMSKEKGYTENPILSEVK